MNTYMDIFRAHEFSSNHAKQIKDSQNCGCFYCLKVFSPELIKTWSDGLETALCPFCDIDAILPEHPEYTLNHAFLKEMHDYWF